MDRRQALRLLESSKQRERLVGARYLARNAESGDLIDLAAALDRERVRYVRIALERAVQHARGGSDSETEFAGQSDSLDQLSSDQYRRAIEETTKRIVHELAPIAGQLDYQAAREIEDYTRSATRGEVRKLHELLDAIRALAQAAEPARVEEFDLSELVHSTCIEMTTTQVVVRPAGPPRLHALGDTRLIAMALRNGIRNSIEATLAITPAEKAVIVSWGLGDREAWVSVLDEGVGLRGEAAALFGPGRTNKSGHLGVGLTIARMVAEQHGGLASLDPRAAGAKFQLRWPQEAD